MLIADIIAAKNNFAADFHWLNLLPLLLKDNLYNNSSVWLVTASLVVFLSSILLCISYLPPLMSW